MHSFFILACVQVIKFLLGQEEVDVNKLTQKGTALHLACSINKSAYVSLFLAHGADPSVMNNEGYIPSDLCTSEEIVRIIAKETKNAKNVGEMPSETIEKVFIDTVKPAIRFTFFRTRSKTIQ